jgi:hypothetical protein
VPATIRLPPHIASVRRGESDHERDPHRRGVHALAVPGTIKVEVTVGKAAGVELRGEADLLAKVTTTVKDGVLVLDTPKRA